MRGKHKVNELIRCKKTCIQIHPHGGEREGFHVASVGQATAQSSNSFYKYFFPCKISICFTNHDCFINSHTVFLAHLLVCPCLLTLFFFFLFWPEWEVVQGLGVLISESREGEVYLKTLAMHLFAWHCLWLSSPCVHIQLDRVYPILGGQVFLENSFR